MILGLGVDIIEIKRVEQALTRRPSLLRRLFTPEEVRYCEARPGSRYAHFAGRFAAKEAVAKAQRAGQADGGSLGPSPGGGRGRSDLSEHLPFP